MKTLCERLHLNRTRVSTIPDNSCITPIYTAGVSLFPVLFPHQLSHPLAISFHLLPSYKLACQVQPADSIGHGYVILTCVLTCRLTHPLISSLIVQQVVPVLSY